MTLLEPNYYITLRLRITVISMVRRAIFSCYFIFEIQTLKNFNDTEYCAMTHRLQKHWAI
jgi:hypothetical protein